MTGELQRKPVVYNIETTNECRMKCTYCPGSTLMTRPLDLMQMWLFERIVEQIEPWSDSQWERWESFALWKYDVPESEVSEDNFFLYVIPKVITLHGFGEPLLDPYIADRVDTLSEAGIPSYLSTHVYDMGVIEKLFEAGLDYLKFSLYSEKIRDVVKMRDKGGYATQIILSLVGGIAHEIKGVYSYGKSQDQVWYKDSKPVKSIHWAEPCKFPWSSMTIQANGDVVACNSDYNSELVMGNIETESLWNIWNGDKYRHLREHQGRYERCVKRCDRNISI